MQLTSKAWVSLIKIENFDTNLVLIYRNKSLYEPLCKYDMYLDNIRIRLIHLGNIQPLVRKVVSIKTD